MSQGKIPSIETFLYTYANESEYLAAFKTCLRIEATVQFLKELAHVLRSPHIGPVLFRDRGQHVSYQTNGGARHIKTKPTHKRQIP